MADERQAVKLASPKQSITLEQGQSVILAADGVTVKVANNKFHSLTNTTFVMVDGVQLQNNSIQPRRLHGYSAHR